MTSWTLTAKDEARLVGVHPDIVRVLRRAAKDGCPRYTVIEGLRALKRQAELVKAGASKTMRSRHLNGLAVDIAPVIGGKVSWDWPAYYPLAAAIKAAAKAEGVTLNWGGDWRTFKDGPHWELPHSTYPDPK